MALAPELCLQIEQDFTELRKQYTLFFSGQVKVEPYELREEIMGRIKRLRNLSNLRTEDQFRANNLITKVQTHVQLWDRQLEQRNRGQGFQRPKATAQQPPKQQEPEYKSIVISHAGLQRDRVEELYDEYTRLNLLLGARKIINFAKFQSFIQDQTQKVQAKGVENVRYEVMVQDQKVVIKAKSER
jgi:hypothetical protein